MKRCGHSFSILVQSLILVSAASGLKHGASGDRVPAMRSVSTCGPQGIRHHNETLGISPKVNISCSQLTVKVDSSIDITCHVVSSSFAKITWSHNGEQKKKNHVTVDKKTCGQTLKIRSAEIRDTGNYTCAVANQNGTVTRTCALRVIGDKTTDVHVDHLRLSGRRKTALLGGTVKLTCNMLNADNAFWIKDGKKVKGDERRVWNTRNTFRHRGMLFSLKISNVTVHDEGRYMCLGFKYGKSANKTFNLKTEPCPEGYHCPYNTNFAFRCPSRPVPSQAPSVSSHGTESQAFVRCGGFVSRYSPLITILVFVGKYITFGENGMYI